MNNQYPIRTLALVALLFAAAAVPVLAQKRTFKWQTEACEMSGTYNAKKVAKERLADTVKLMTQYSSAGLNAPTTVFKPADLPSLSVAALDAEYKQKRAEIASLKVLATPYWTKQQQEKLRELDQYYALSRVTIRGHKEPRALLEFPGAELCKTKYAQPLIAGGDALLNAWRTLTGEQAKKNADPARIRREYEAQLASSDRMKFALVEVMTFGWWNCANESIDYVQYDETQEREFEKQFTNIRRDCDEP